MKQRFVIWLLIIGITIICVSENIEAQNTEGLSTLAWSPDGSLIATADANGSLSLFDAKTGHVVKQFNAHQTKVTSLSWRSDGARLASISPDDGLIHIWDNNGKLIKELAGEKSYERAAYIKWNPKRDLLLSVAGVTDGGSLIQIWNTQNNQYQLLPSTYNVSAYDMAWSPDGTTLAVADYRGVYLFSDFSTEQLKPVTLAPFAFTIAWSPNGSELATADTTGIIQIINVASGKSRASFQDSIHDANHRIATLSWSPDGQLLASDYYDGITQFWDTRSGDLVSTSDAKRSGWRNLITWSPFGGRLALGSSTIPETETASKSIANNTLQIIVPAPSLERFQAIAQSCGLSATKQQSLIDEIKSNHQDQFATELQALPTSDIPAGCADDLLAIGNALKTD